MNTLNGDSNIAFFQALQRQGDYAFHTKVLSLSVSEEEAIAIEQAILLAPTQAGVISRACSCRNR